MNCSSLIQSHFKGPYDFVKLLLILALKIFSLYIYTPQSSSLYPWETEKDSGLDLTHSHKG